jgi:hypothetical protein
MGFRHVPGVVGSALGAREHSVCPGFEQSDVREHAGSPLGIAQHPYTVTYRDIDI